MASFLDRILSRGPKTKVLTQEQAARSVVVSNIAPQTADENVVIYFQKQKNGGGEIDYVHIPKEGTAVITFESSEVVDTVLEHSHTLEGSTLKLHRLSPEEPPEVFQQVEARVNFDKFHLLPEESKNMLEVIKDNTRVAYRKGSKDYFVSGTFSQIKAAHKLLQCLMNQKMKGGEKEVIDYVKTTAHSQQDYSNGLDELTSDKSTIAASISFEVQPQFMKLLKRVYKTKLQEIEENFCVQIVWDENTPQVCISPKEMSNRQDRRFQEGCDAFIDLYQKFHPNMGREEVDLPNSADEERIIKAVSLAEAEDPVIIEQLDKKLVVYAEKNSIRRSVQSLKERLGLTNDGNSKKTKRGQGNKRRDAFEEENETSQQGRYSLAKRLRVLDNGVKLSLYQGDITDERVDAIVNAANERLQHGAGVAAAIVRKGGQQIQDESNWVTNKYGPLNVGEAAHTCGGNLPCRYVIHTVGPRWKEHGKEKSIYLLHRACVESLRHAAQLELSSIALTAISSGIFGMPKDICAEVMFKAVEEFSSSEVAEFNTLRDVRIVIIDAPTISVFQEEFVKRYFSQEASLETVTTQTRPSDEQKSTSSTPDSKLDVDRSKDTDPFVLGDQTRSGRDNDVDSSGVAPVPDEGKSGQRAVDDSLSNQDTAKKGNPPVSVELPKMEGNDLSHDLKQKKGAPVVNPVKAEESADFKVFSRQGRGKGTRNIAAKFQTSPAEKEKSVTSNGSTRLEGTFADSGTGRGMICNTTPPPGLAVSEEGKNLAKSHENRVTGDPKSNVDGSSIDKNDVENNESNSDSLKEVNNRNNDVENPDLDSHNGSPIDHSPSGNNFTPDDKMPDQDKTTRESERPSSDGCRKRPPVEHTENVKPIHDQFKDDNMKTGKKLKQEPEPVAHPTNDETMLSQDPLTLATTGGEVQTPIKSSAEDDSTTSCPHSSSDQPVSHQRGNEADNDNTKERRNVKDHTSQDSDSSPPPLCDMQVSHEKSEPKCLMCMNFNKDLLSPFKCGRSHYYCESCIKHLLEKAGLCPQCDKEERFQGNQPIGYMTWITAQNSLPGYEDCEVIIMSFTFHRGTQGPEHPNPGQPYSALYTSAFLPCNSDGKEVCSLLERAFNAGLLFTIGTSPTTGEENKIILNGIELKSNQGGGPASYGYPDPSYLDRVKKQLAEKGITQLHG